MKRRLTDHDEDALWWLAQVCNRYASEWRPSLGYVWIRDGWAVASDAYRALVLPVDLEVDGLVASDDALTGGTVTVLRPDPDWREDMWDLVTKFPHRHGNDALLDHRALTALARWRRRAIDPDESSDRTLAYVVPKWIGGGRHPELILPDGAAVLLSDPSHPLVTGSCVQAPYLASVAVPLGLIYGEVWMHGISPEPVARLELGPDGPAVDGWGLVMPVFKFRAHLHERMTAAIARNRSAS